VGGHSWDLRSFPYLFGLASSSKKPRAPHKFNLTWLKEPEYLKLVTEFWKAHPLPNDQMKANGFGYNLVILRRISIDWTKGKKSREEHTLCDIKISWPH